MGQSESRFRWRRRRFDGDSSTSPSPARQINDSGDNNLYRSRSTRSFADISVSVFRRILRRMRDWLHQQSQPKVEVIELSPMASQISQDFIEVTPTILPEDNDHIFRQCSREKDDEISSAEEAFKEVIELKEVKKLEYLNFPFLTDSETIRWIKRNRIVFLMRGLSGSGKSTLVNAITETYDCQNPIVCSADHYFIDKFGIYRFDQSRLKDAHESSQSLMKMSCNEGKKMIIIDNTNIQAWEMRAYFSNVSKAPFTYRLVIVEPQTPWKLDPEQLSIRNTHSVSQEVLSKRVTQFQEAVPLYFAWFLSPADSRSIYDRAMILFRNIYETCQEFKRDFGKFSAMLNLGSAMSYYNRDMMISGNKSALHCTAKFIGFRKPKEEMSQDIQDYVGKVKSSLGIVHRLKIIGFFFTKETIGCRVQLDENQLQIYDQDENLKKLPPRNYAKSNEKSNQMKSKDDFKETITIEEISNNQQEFRSIQENKGYKAHITVATAPGVKPVNCGIDLLEIVQAEEDSKEEQDEQDTFDIPDTEDVLKHYKDHFWVVYLNEALTVQSIFTGHY